MARSCWWSKGSWNESSLSSHFFCLTLHLLFTLAEILSIPKGPWDLNPNACNADYTGSANELYVSKNGEDEMSSIWREYKKNDKWCLLEVSYSDDECLSDVYDFLAKSN